MEYIEIPFGAMDSENKGWEYTIPAGMEAVIEDGKVIVREKESEDERMRKDIVAAVEMYGDFTQSRKEEIYSYLEKQNNLGKYSEEENLAYRLNWVMQDYYKAGKDDKEKEHRLKCYQLFWDALEDANFFEQKPAEWSEEEQQIIETAACTIIDFSNTVETKEEEEELCELASKLQDLKPQSNWKPSEEQMEAMRKSFAYWQGITNEVPSSNLLESLYNDLQKLL